MSTDTPPSLEEDTTQQLSLSVIMPVLNEAASIEFAVRRSIAALETWTTELEILVIDDGSSDESGEIVERLAAEDSRVRVLHNGRNLNYGLSLLRGIRAASNDWVLHNGADLPLAPEDVEGFSRFFDDADVIVVRRVDRAAQSAWRTLTSWINNLLIRLLFAPQTTDQNFVQLYRRSQVQPTKVVSTSPAFVTPELILRAERRGLRVREVVAKFQRREAGQSHFGRLSDILWTLRDMVRFRVRTWRYGWKR